MATHKLIAAEAKQQAPWSGSPGLTCSSGSGWAFTPDPSTLARLGHDLTRAYLNLADTSACPAGPEVLLPYAEDTMGLVLKRHKTVGQHGGFSWGVQHIPLVIAGSGVRHGRSGFPAKLVDIAPTIERLLGLRIPEGVDGVVLSDAFTRQTATDQAAQRVIASQRFPDVRVLHAHSLSQSASR